MSPRSLDADRGLCYCVTAAFHGHAHRGRPEGRTGQGVPIYNVALPILKSQFPDRPAFRVFEVPRASPAGSAAG